MRTVVKVLRPCDPAAANDDYQDARVLSQTDEFVELEVIHYPLNTNAAAIEGSRDWKTPPTEAKADLAAGLTTNWDEPMRRDRLKALAADGIKLDELSDKEVVERVSAWLLKRGKYRYMFGTYFVHFPEGKAEILPGLEDAFRREQGNTELPLAQHFEHELFGKGMYYNKCYGTCTSTATYLTTVLRALGIPTRMILAIPPVDGSDPAQVQLIKDHVAQHAVRRTLLDGIATSGFASHTYNEVYVGGRWRRLNYAALGQNSYGPGAMGMLTHVLTFRDLSDAGLTKTWGWRYGRAERDDTFEASNPYRTTELSDRLGIHAKLTLGPAPDSEIVAVTKAYWFFSKDRPDSIPAESVQLNSDGHLLLHVERSFADLERVYPNLNKEFALSADGHPPVQARAERGYWNSECYLRIPADDNAAMAPDVSYRLAPADADGEYVWKVADDVRIVKPTLK
jgi:hypothetical protein